VIFFTFAFYVCLKERRKGRQEERQGGNTFVEVRVGCVRNKK
jgi:hypothetical protein